MHDEAKTGRSIVIVLSLLLAGTAVFWNSLHGPFIYDDHFSVLENSAIRTLWPPHWLTTSPANSPVQGRPLPAATLAINYALGGFEVTGYHLLNLLVHLGNALILFALVKQALDLPSVAARFRRDRVFLAFACALIWLIHPVQTECVDYISQRTESLMGLCYLGTLYLALRAHASPRPAKWRWAAIAVCALGMTCKESMVTAPFMVLLFEALFLPGTFREQWRAKKGFYLGLCATWLVLVLLMTTRPLSNVGLGFAITPWEYAKNQCVAIVDYLRLVFWPHPLVLDYGLPRMLPLEVVLPQALVVVSLVGVACLILLRRPRAGFLGAWFFILLSPTSSFVPMATEVAAERRLYLPLAAMILAVLLLLHPLFAGTRTRRRAGFAVVLLAAALLSFATVRRNSEYATTLGILHNAIEAKPDNPRPYHNLASEYFRQGRMEEAETYYRSAVEVEPRYVLSRFALAEMLQARGAREEAMAHYREVIRIQPDHAGAQANLGALLAADGRQEEALACFERALNSDPDRIVALNGCARLLAKGTAAERARALALAERAAALTRHENPMILVTLAEAHAGTGDFDKALAVAQEALKQAKAANLEALVAYIQERMDGYRSGRP